MDAAAVGGGGHGGGGGGHGGGGHSCTEVSTVVGRQHCAQIRLRGACSRISAAIEFDTELFHEHFLLAPMSANRHRRALRHAVPYRVTTNTAGARRRGAYASAPRGKSRDPNLHGASELDLGGLSSAPAMQQSLPSS